jgi:hypothetical protein
MLRLGFDWKKTVRAQTKSFLEICCQLCFAVLSPKSKIRCRKSEKGNYNEEGFQCLVARDLENDFEVDNTRLSHLRPCLMLVGTTEMTVMLVDIVFVTRDGHDGRG